MVLAAPLFMMAQTKALRAFWVANRQGFTTMGVGVLVSYLALRLLSKVYETDELKKQVASAQEDLDVALRTARDAGLLARVIAAGAAAAVPSHTTTGTTDDLADAQAAMSAALDAAVASARARRAAAATGLSLAHPVSAVAAGAEHLRQAVGGVAHPLASMPSGAATSAATAAAAAAAANAAAAGVPPAAAPAETAGAGAAGDSGAVVVGSGGGAGAGAGAGAKLLPRRGLM